MMKREREKGRQRPSVKEVTVTNHLYSPCPFFIINFSRHIKAKNVNFRNADYALIVHRYDNLQVLVWMG